MESLQVRLEIGSNDSKTNKPVFRFIIFLYQSTPPTLSVRRLWFQVTYFMIRRDFAPQLFRFQENCECFAVNIPSVFPPCLKPRPGIICQHETFPACPDFFIKIAFSLLIKHIFKVTETLEKQLRDTRFFVRTELMVVFHGLNKQVG